MRRKALSRWVNEGGALAAESVASDAQPPDLTNTELVHLRIRVIALENLVLGMLTAGNEQQLDVVREMAACITPREGHTNHPLTVQAADHMTDLIKRAIHFRSLPSK
jgi:hypothetical protein